MLDSTAPTLAADISGATAQVAFSGTWTIRFVQEVDEQTRSVTTGSANDVVLDLGGVTALDTAGAWIIHRLKTRLEQGRARVDYANVQEDHLILLNEVSEHGDGTPLEGKRRSAFVVTLGRMGIAVENAWQRAVQITGFFGLIIRTLFRTLINPGRARITSTIYHMEQTGFNAVPIVALLSFLIGGVLAYQGSVQLRDFGAEIFTVDLVSISILREIGILITAIIVAGRSGSAFAAQIGSMKVHEEIDAMQTLALDPMEMLVLPRVLALAFMLPILAFVSDIAGLLGGCLVAWAALDISPTMFVDRLVLATDIKHFWVGIIKAPVFAVIIAMIGCYEGMQVRGSAESVGVHTTKAVVEAIFMVIIADALFSIFFVELGW